MSAKVKYTLGIISDTHDYLDPRVSEIFTGVDHILHGGDIIQQQIILGLEQIAPVTAVLGNNDIGQPYRETEVIMLAGRKFLIHHILNPRRLGKPICERIEREKPEIVIFGHTHERFCETIGGIMYLNPGYSGRPKHELTRSVARLTCTDTDLTVEFVNL